ncbi:sensor histidine kinase [Paenibacillus sedimenti]|uniref:Histidine kinase n=1 Tax=Paenibacillus sedimenti TaxID=2770274 RepID=A0A926QHN3_9BACL|nr:sensor histidine kinase [Paenibacillus sedimenti]MBD0379736.1 histidine kinase [Paenibacillus sedimenti]
MNFQINSLTFKLFIICLTFMFGTVFIVFQMSYRIIEKEIRSNNDFLIEQMQSKVDQYITLSFAALDTILYAVESAHANDMHNSDEILPVLRKLYNMNANSVADVYVINEDASMVGASPRSVLFSDPDEQRNELWSQVMQNKTSIYVSVPYRSKQQDWTVTMAKYIGGSNPPKVAALDIDLKAMEQSLLNINRSDLLGIAIVESSGKLVAGNLTNIVEMDERTRTFAIGEVTSDQLLSKSAISGVLYTGTPKRSWYYHKFPGSRFNWTIITFHSESLLQQSLKRTETYNLAMLGIGLVLSAITATFITHYIRRPLSFLMSRMRLVKQGFLHIPVVLKRKDEFGELSQSFDLMLKQIIELLEQVKRSHDLQREQEIQVLQSQINPHFLYNTLGSISNAVKLGYLDKVDPIVRSLIRILEYGVANDSRFVPLSDELENVREYLFIQNVRYKSHYQLIENIEPGLESFKVFRLLLQPIVENSLFHGYRNGRLPGEIHIHAYRNPGSVVIDVTDFGLGMTEEQAASALIPRTEDEPRTRKRIGLVNIHQRIQLYYSDLFGLSIETELGRGTCIRATFPYRTGGERN